MGKEQSQFFHLRIVCMQVEESHVLNKAEWDAFVQLHKGTLFNLSAYLDATAEHWLVIWNEQKTGGIPISYTIKAGQLVAVTPFFARYLEWVGAGFDPKALFDFLQQHFAVGDLNVKNDFGFGEKKHYQMLALNDLSLNQQAKRSLKKATSFTISSEDRFDDLNSLLQSELAIRVSSINALSLMKLESLVKQTSDLKIKQLNLWNEGQWCGAVLYIEAADHLLYLKGTVKAEERKNGGMYRLIHQLIQLAFESNKYLDFGGSNVENVRRFNCGFGAKDKEYTSLSWNHAPAWWKGLRWLKSRLRN